MPLLYLLSTQNKTCLFVFLFRQPSIKMQDLFTKYPHLPEKVFQKLDDENLVKCREIATSWKDIIDERNYLWLRVVNIPRILKRGNTYLHWAAAAGQIEAFKIALNEEENKIIENEHGITSFHAACNNGRFEIVALLLKNTDLEIDFNAKSESGKTAFHLACIEGHSDVVKIIMKNAAVLSIDLNTKHRFDGWTPFHSACHRGHSDVVKIFMKNAPALRIDLNRDNNDGNTAFHLACIEGHSDVIKIIMKNAVVSKIGRNTHFIECL